MKSPPAFLVIGQDTGPTPAPPGGAPRPRPKGAGATGWGAEPQPHPAAQAQSPPDSQQPESGTPRRERRRQVWGPGLAEVGSRVGGEWARAGAALARGAQTFL